MRYCVIHFREFAMFLRPRLMKFSFASLILLGGLGLGGCASTQTNGRVERITPEQLAAIKPAPNPKIPLAEVVALSKAADRKSVV